MRASAGGSGGLQCVGEFRQVPVCAGVGSGGKFRKVRRVPKVCGRFWRVPVRAGVCCGGKLRKVPEGSGEFRRVLV